MVMPPLVPHALKPSGCDASWTSRNVGFYSFWMIQREMLLRSRRREDQGKCVAAQYVGRDRERARVDNGTDNVDELRLALRATDVQPIVMALIELAVERLPADVVAR
jgi:hypothetical protein